MFKRMVVLFMLIITLTACNQNAISIQRGQEGGLDITVRASETEVNTLLTNALANTANPLVYNPSVDLQNGQLVISGELDWRDGSGRVSGDFTLVLSVVDGTLEARVTAVNIEGWAANDERLAEINRQVQQALQGRALRDNPNVTLLSVVISDNALEFVLNATPSR